MNSTNDPRSAPYNEGQPPMARTGARRMLIIAVGVVLFITGLIVVNTRHEIQEGASKSAQSQSTPAAPKQ